MLIEQQVVDVHHLRLPEVAFYKVVGVERVHHAQLLLDLLLDGDVHVVEVRFFYIRLLTPLAALIKIEEIFLSVIPVAIAVIWIGWLTHIAPVFDDERRTVK